LPSGYRRRPCEFGLPSPEISTTRSPCRILPPVFEEDGGNGGRRRSRRRRIPGPSFPGLLCAGWREQHQFWFSPPPENRASNSVFSARVLRAGLHAAIISSRPRILALAQKSMTTPKEVVVGSDNDARRFDGTFCTYDPPGELTSVSRGCAL